MKPIVKVPHKVLTTPTKEVLVVDKRVKKLIEQMKESLKNADNPKGVGLAATQIGLNIRIFILWPDDTLPMRAIINPKIIESSKATVRGIPGSDHRLEGCLSIPNVWGMVTRNKSVTISYLSEEGQPMTETFSGFPAIVVQHEIDHLDGILFTMRVIEQKETLYKPVYDAKGNERLEPIEF